jgi:hypothetical protein
MRPVRCGTARGAAACDREMVACARDPEASNQGSGLLPDEGTGALFREQNRAVRRAGPRPSRRHATTSEKQVRSLHGAVSAPPERRPVTSSEKSRALRRAVGCSRVGGFVTSAETGRALVGDGGCVAGSRVVLSRERFRALAASGARPRGSLRVPLRLGVQPLRGAEPCPARSPNLLLRESERPCAGRRVIGGSRRSSAVSTRSASVAQAHPSDPRYPGTGLLRLHRTRREATSLQKRDRKSDRAHGKKCRTSPMYRLRASRGRQDWRQPRRTLPGRKIRKTTGPMEKTPKPVRCID